MTRSGIEPTMPCSRHERFYHLATATVEWAKLMETLKHIPKCLISANKQNKLYLIPYKIQN